MTTRSGPEHSGGGRRRRCSWTLTRFIVGFDEGRAVPLLKADDEVGRRRIVQPVENAHLYDLVGQGRSENECSCRLDESGLRAP